ncbi:multiple inositol polyphosphate phosphatase-like [Raphidocelis subcapitata]|uniref:Multiple inositol polyphosphate phosphatase 1 n=1 Tax=Raphidocelis subcapitata TaxID=307507 RepID=A0A2V0PA61_9CHLO|nr:multiple inositol polyphosphate phosphatase-like [Raphidocelis subcapitata]|eukprot:GBF94793.1 multiple inositol polyphosphate phosphatase-like [Raphidocelis subcapitata]
MLAGAASSGSGAGTAAAAVAGRLSTKTPYAWRVPTPGAPSLYSQQDPPGYEPVALYLVARHGSRWPTLSRTKQMHGLAPLLRMVNPRTHPWVLNFSAPLLEYTAGELHPMGEDEMAALAHRMRHRFPGLLDRPYFPRRYHLVSTEVPRAAQSASAFSLGLFQRCAATGAAGDGSGGGGGGGLGARQPVALRMKPKRRDPTLRFFDMCPQYLAHEETVERWLAPWLWHHWEQLLPAVEARLGLPPGAAAPSDVDALWQLCGLHAGLLAVPGGGACAAFGPEEAGVMEWLEDVRLAETQGPGAPINSRIAGVLLGDLGASLRAAADSAAAGREPLPAARLHFAHCETLTPLLTLMGLFGSEGGGKEGSGTGKGLVGADGVPRSARHVAGAVDSLVDDGQLAVARRLQQEGSGGGAASWGGAPSSSVGSGFSSDGSDGGGSVLSGYSGGDEADSGSAASSGGAFDGGDRGAAGRVFKGRAVAGGPLEPPPGWAPRIGPPGADREWRGGRIAPLAANLMVVLYKAVAPRPPPGRERFLVRLVHNEQVLAPPLCGGGRLDCGLEEFLGAVVGGRAADAAALLEMCGGGEGEGEGEGGGGGADGWGGGLDF